MSRRAARFTQADMARALRALRQAGGGRVVVRPDGEMLVETGMGVDLTDPLPEQDGKRKLRRGVL